MKHLAIRQRLASRLHDVIRDPSLPQKPRNYQVEGIDKFIAWLKDRKAGQRGYFSWATGLGKTLEFSLLIRACADLRVLVIEPSKQLVEQTIKTVFDYTSETIAHASSQSKIITPDGEQILHWKNGDGDHRVIVSTDESFKLGYERFHDQFEPDVIVWDECHWGYSDLAQQALGAFPEALVVAFSATPDYLTTTCKPGYVPVTLDNGQVLYCPEDRMARAHFGDLIDERTMRWGIQEEYLAPLAWGRIEFKFSLEGIPVVDGPGGMDYEQSALSRHLAKNWPDVVDVICKLYRSGQYGLSQRFAGSICPGVTQAEELAEALKGLGLNAAAITNKTKDDERRRILDAGDAGELVHATSVFALREGWDSKRLEVAMMLRPTKSRVLYVQFMGRAIRIDPDNPDKVALILDPHYQDTKFAPLSVPALFGKPGQAVIDGGIVIGPGRGKRARKLSPYALINAQPVLVVQPVEINYWAGSGGFFEADGERWGALISCAEEVGLSRSAVKNRLSGVRNRPGKDATGKPWTFYALSDVREACADLLEDLPQAGPDGTFEADGERWAPISVLQDLLCVSDRVLQPLITECRQCKGKDRSSILRSFYALSDVREACADLLEDLPQAGPDGTFEADGERWGTRDSLANFVPHIRGSQSNVRLQGCKNRRGKGVNGTTRDFYALSDVMRAYADLLEDLPQAGPDGTFEADGERWVTISAASQSLGKLSEPTIRPRVIGGGCPSKRGKSYGGQINDFYAISDIKNVCADLLEDLPQAGPDGTFEADGERWGTASALAKRLNLSGPTVVKRSERCRSRYAKGGNGVLCAFFPISDLRMACADLLEDLPQAGPDGTFEADGERWGTRNAIAQVLGFSGVAITKKSEGCRTRAGKNVKGVRNVFYALSDVKEACADLLSKRTDRPKDFK